MENILKENPLEIIYQQNWIETVGNNEEIAYGDTDSLYLKVAIPFNKFEDVSKTVDYTQKIAKRANKNYKNVLDGLLHERAGLNPEYNLMDFKSEVVAYRGFFRSKKYYALAKIWDEGNFLATPKLKKTGGQILKSDSTKITYDLLTEVYENLVLNFEITDEFQLYKIIFKDLKDKYSNLIHHYINEFKIDQIAIPKRWGNKTFKMIPSQVRGAMLYNFIYTDTLRPGDSIMTIQIKIKSFQKLLDHYNKKLQENKLSKYQITKDDINNKLNYISVPYGIDAHPEELKKIKETLNYFDIELNYDTIVDFNIDMKLTQFNVLFSEEIKRKLV